MLGHPLDDQDGVVFAKEVVVEALLCEEGADEVFEGDQRILLVVKESHRLEFPEKAEYLKV